MPSIARQAKYTTAAARKSQKCHGALERTGSTGVLGASSTAPQRGHLPSSVSVPGFQNRSQGSHQGITDSLPNPVNAHSNPSNPYILGASHGQNG
ncbi:MAG: hypothetical protein OXF21_01175, partial [bacterium]|nr:hypothetical protein [bacterium]